MDWTYAIVTAYRSQHNINQDVTYIHSKVENLRQMKNDNNNKKKLIDWYQLIKICNR